jgi:hypothetical protein
MPNLRRFLLGLPMGNLESTPMGQPAPRKFLLGLPMGNLKEALLSLVVTSLYPTLSRKMFNSKREQMKGLTQREA